MVSYRGIGWRSFLLTIAGGACAVGVVARRVRGAWQARAFYFGHDRVRYW